MKPPGLFTIIILTVVAVATAQATTEEVSLQYSICGADPFQVLQSLGQHSKPPFKRNPITYFDLKERTYTTQGFMFRRKINKHIEISAVKVRFENKTLVDVPENLNVSCEWDRYGERSWYTCQRRDPLAEIAHGLWSDAQRAFVEHYCDDIAWDELVPYGPFWNTKWKVDVFPVEEVRTVFDTVTVGEEDLMEIELKVPKDRADSVHVQISQHLEEIGVRLCERQEPRTLRVFRALDKSHRRGQALKVQAY
jgi:hypothetical protein